MSNFYRKSRHSWLAPTVAIVGLLGVGLGTAGPARAETIIRMNEVGPGEIDPARALTNGAAILMYNIYDTLLLPGPGGKGIEPHLAESYSVDGKIFTFKLRPNVRFHSGNELTADDVVYSLNRMMAIGAGWSALFRGWVKTVEAADKLTVRITLTDNYAPFLAALFRLGIVDSKLVIANAKEGSFGEFKDYGVAFLSANDAGSGAYKVMSHAAQTETVLQKNATYFLGATPKAPDRVRMSYGLEGATELALMRRGELDIMSLWTSPETKRSAAQIPGVTIVGEGGMAEYVIKLNTKRAPLDDVHCRRALGYAIDYAGLMSQANITPQIKGAKPAKGPVLEGMLGYDSSVPDPVRDMEKAKSELAQCRYKPADQEIDISWIAEIPIEERFALLMQSNWGELGFKTKVTRYPWTSYSQLVSKPETTPQISQLFFNARTPDPDSMLYSEYSSRSAGAYTAVEWLQNPQVDALLDKGRSTLDAGERDKIYRQLNQLINELRPSIFGYEVVTTYPKANHLKIPGLDDASKNARIYGLNFAFRNAEVN